MFRKVSLGTKAIHNHSPLFHCFSGLFSDLPLVIPPEFSLEDDVNVFLLLREAKSPEVCGAEDGVGHPVPVTSTWFAVTVSSFFPSPHSDGVPWVVEGFWWELVGEERGGRRVVVFGFAQKKFHHCAHTGEARKTSARQRRTAPILLTVVVRLKVVQLATHTEAKQVLFSHLQQVTGERRILKEVKIQEMMSRKKNSKT